MEKQKVKVGRLLFILFLFFFTILIVVFFQSSLSKVQQIHVEGVDKLTTTEVIAQSGIAVGDQILLVRKQKVREALTTHPVIEDVEVTIHFPGNVTVHVREFETVAYLYSSSQQLYPVLKNGYVVEQERVDVVQYPLITEWEDPALLPNFCKELAILDTVVMQQISEVRLEPNENDPYRLVLYMRDGFEVHTSIVQFAKHLKNYLYVVENVAPNEVGVINLSDAGVYYISYEQLEQDEEELP